MHILIARPDARRAPRGGAHPAFPAIGDSSGFDGRKPPKFKISKKTMPLFAFRTNEKKYYVLLAGVTLLFFFGLVNKTEADSETYSQDLETCSLGQTLNDCDEALYGKRSWSTDGTIYATSSPVYAGSMAGVVTPNQHFDIDDFFSSLYNSTNSLVHATHYFYFPDKDGSSGAYMYGGLTGASYRFVWDGSSIYDLYNSDGTIKLADNIMNSNNWAYWSTWINCETGTGYTNVIGNLSAYSASLAGITCGAAMQFNFNRTQTIIWNFDNIDIDVYGSPPNPLGECDITWYHPSNGASYNSTDPNTDWVLYVDMDENSSRTYNVLIVNYTNSAGENFNDFDYIATTTDLQEVIIERTRTLPDGTTSAWAKVIGTDLEGELCYGDLFPNDGCVWYDSCLSDTIEFTASTTGWTIETKPGRPGFTGYARATSTEELTFLEGLFKTSLDGTMGILGGCFPFVIGKMISEAWTEADSSEYEIPTDWQFLDVIEDDGDIDFEIMPAWGAKGSAINLSIGSSTYLAMNHSQDTTISIYQTIKKITKWLLYLIFFFYLCVRAYRLYNHWSEAHQPDL